MLHLSLNNMRVLLPARIAIDGPSAAGKNTLGAGLARRLNYDFIDTGVMFRSVALLVQERNIDPGSSELVIEMAKIVAISTSQKLIGTGTVPDLRVFLEKADISDRLKDTTIENLASITSQIPELRKILLEKQRELAAKGNIVMVGRDTGTIVIPDAELKIFLTASPKTRAMRRFNEYNRIGNSLEYKDILSKMIERDIRDQTRAIAPLKKAHGAFVIDTENLDIDGVLSEAWKLITAMSNGELSK